MEERRAAPRKRVLFGAVAANLAGDKRYDCVVKDMSDLGARVDLPESADLPEDLALTVTQTGAEYRARIVWRRGNAVGLAFTSAPATAYAPEIALDNQIRDTKEAARLLNRVVDEALGDA